MKFHFALCLFVYICRQFSYLLIQDITISYPWWFLLVIITIGLFYASLLYVKNKKLKVKPIWKTILFVFRFLSACLLSFLLLSPLLKSNTRYVEKPVIIFAIDNSNSIVLGKDSTYFQSVFSSELQEIKNLLTEKYNVDEYLFGEQIRKSTDVSYNDTYSDYSGIFSFLREEYAGANVGALIISGDGISNRGIDPEFALGGISWPVYTIALGDTASNKDVLINDVRYNSIVYLDDSFPLEVSLTATGLKGKKSKVDIYAFGKKVDSQSFTITNDNFNQTLNFRLNAEKNGKQRIRIDVQRVEDELTVANNSRNIFIEVLNNRQKILILGYGPHPDLGAIKSSLETNRNYEVVVETNQLFKENIQEYDLVILHQLPSMRVDVQRLIGDLQEKKIPLLFVLGKQSNINRFNSIFKALELRSSPGNHEEAQIVFNPAFSNFSFSREYADMLETLPPLIVPFGTYRMAGTAEVFGYQNINRITTDLPLVMFNESDGHRMGLVAGEGIWLWRIQSYLQYGNAGALNSLLSKTAQYLMARNDRRFFRITTEGEYSSNKKVILKAELFNSSYELVNEPDVNLKLTNDKDAQFNYVFSPDEQAYTLDLDRLPEGVYKYTGSTTLGNNKFVENGEFVVTQQSLESRNLKANHALLYRIAETQNGEMLYRENMTRLPEMLNNRTDLKNKIYFEEKYTGLQNLMWVFLLLTFLLAFEWFFRKYLGGY